METSDIHKGVRFLRKYLRENRHDFREMSLEEFKLWVASEISHKNHDPVFLQRCKVRDIKKKHSEPLISLEKALQEAIQHLDACVHKQRLEELEQGMENSRKAIEGLTQAVKNSTGEKRTACKEKLRYYKTRWANLKKEWQLLLKATPEKRELLRASAELSTFREKIGLTQEEQYLDNIVHKSAHQSTKAGSTFEDMAFLVISQEIIPIATKNLRIKKKQKAKVLSQVTLGCARAEIDYMVILPPAEEGAPAQVLAIVEVKRNINDIVHGFLLRQENLRWFTGDKGGYDAAIYRTKLFQTGHFDRVAMHEQNGEKFSFDKSSFQHFHKDEKTTHFLDNLFFVTSRRRLLGMNSGEYAKIIYKIGMDTEFDLENSAYMEKLFLYAKNMLSPFQTREVLELYASQIKWGRQLLFIERR
jgi:hypothetical protein